MSLPRQLKPAFETLVDRVTTLEIQVRELQNKVFMLECGPTAEFTEDGELAGFYAPSPPPSP